METLDSTLERIAVLKADLTAETIIQEQESHWETGYKLDPSGGGTSVDRTIIEVEEEIIDKPRITEPDTQKRELTRLELRQIIDASPWYSAKYFALEVLTGNKSEANTYIRLWAPKLEAMLEAETETRARAIEDILRLVKISNSSEAADLLEKAWKGTADVVERSQAVKILQGHQEQLARLVQSWIPELQKQMEINTEIKRNVVDELANLLIHSDSKDIIHLLREIWKNDNDSVARVKAGKALGYSKIRIWLHEALRR